MPSFYRTTHLPYEVISNAKLLIALIYDQALRMSCFFQKNRSDAAPTMQYNSSYNVLCK